MVFEPNPQFLLQYLYARLKTNRFKACFVRDREKKRKLMVAACDPISTNNIMEKKSLEFGEIRKALTYLNFVHDYFNTIEKLIKKLI